MLKTLICLLYLLQPAANLPAAQENCQPVGNLQKTGETLTTFSMSWSGTPGATEYKLWYVRHDDAHASSEAFTTGTAFTFTDLPSGNYTFYVAVVCPGEVSSWTGIQDTIIN